MEPNIHRPHVSICSRVDSRIDGCLLEARQKMECFRDSDSSFQPLDLQLHDSCPPPLRWVMVPDSWRLNFLPELTVTPLGLFGSRVEAIPFCPDRVARLSVSSDPLSQSHRGPEETQETPPPPSVRETLRKASWALFPKDGRTATRAPGLCPASAGPSVPRPRHSLALITRKRGVLTWTATNCVSFGKTLPSPGLMSPIYKTKDLD